MKTLNEVIKAEEICSQIDAECSKCPYKATAKGWCEEKDRDALHYLKEYRDECNNIINVHDDCIRLRDEMAEELNKMNPPLTWDELEAMEGKPVWIELAYQMAWGLNDGTYIDAFGHEVVTIKVLHDLWHLDKAQMGKVWQAFRKERE